MPATLFRKIWDAHTVRRLPNGQTLFGCYHPSRQNTNTGKLTAQMMDDVFTKVRAALEIAGVR